MQFSHITGQAALKEQLITAANSGRIAHAQLFLGPEGNGALALAIAYAQYLSCTEKIENDSCGKCSSCRKYEKLIHPDLHFIFPFFPKDKGDVAFNYYAEWREALIGNPYTSLEVWRGYLEAENKQANINIATCHEVIKKLMLKPYESEYKVMIMWLPEYLDKEGNSLLKIIEEPPAKTLFLLVAEQQEQLLNTIRSRTQLVKVPKLKDADIHQYLVEQKGIAENNAKEITFLANGNIAEALTLSVALDESYSDFFKAWMRLCWSGDMAKQADAMEAFAKMGRENQKGYFRYALDIIRETLLYGQGSKNLLRLSGAELDFVEKFASIITTANAPQMISELEKAAYHIERNANPKILFFDLSLTFCRLIRLKEEGLGFLLN